MTKVENKILINVEDDETRVALLKGDHLENLHIEQTNRAQKVGNIYCGKVVKIQPSFQAAFIDYGEERHGFLSISDINFQVYKSNREGRGRSSISQVLKIGQKVLVQVIKDEIAHKGASLTTNISIAGRFLVFMPDSERGGVSKKIEDEEQRNRLRHLLKGLGNENSSAIIRTVGVDRSLTELKRDYTILRKTWTDIKNDYESESIPKLLYKEEEAMLRMIRDYYNDTVSEVYIDEPVAFQHVLEFFQTHLPAEQKKLKLYLGEKSLFYSHGIESQIEILEHKEVPLPSGGSLVIMPTEALVAIDVNSGKSTQEKNIEDTALRTNLEAAEEISRQLRLRNLGGLIVIDFIDMENSKNRILVEQKIEDSMASDKAKTSIGMISKFGLLELSRQRISSSLSNNSNIIALANRILRKIHDTATAEKLLQVHIKLPLELSSHLLNNKRQLLSQMEIDNGIQITISPETNLGPLEIKEMEITIQDQEKIEKQKTIPISSLNINDEKRNQKIEKKKELNDKKSNLDLGSQTSSSLIVPKKTKVDLKSNNKALKKRHDEKGTSDKNQKKENLSSVKKNDLSEPTKNDIQKNNDFEKKIDRISETEISDDSGTIFNSTHEPIDEKALDNSLNQDTKMSHVKKNDDSKTFESVHLDTNKKNLQNNNPKLIEKHPEDSSKETLLYTSIHLDDIKKGTEVSKKQTIDKKINTSKKNITKLKTKNKPKTKKIEHTKISKEKYITAKKEKKGTKTNVDEKISQSLEYEKKEKNSAKLIEKNKNTVLKEPKNKSLKSTKSKNSAA